jgi:hypothetical protein
MMVMYTFTSFMLVLLKKHDLFFKRKKQFSKFVLQLGGSRGREESLIISFNRTACNGTTRMIYNIIAISYALL